MLRTDNDIFSKTKKIDEKDVEFSFQAGISRVMGIYTELLKTEENNTLITYWKEHEAENEWLKGTETPASAIKLANYIIQEVEKNNIYLSKVNLENDLVNSSLFSSLKKFYNTRATKSTVDKMQKAKAENMLKFLKVHFEDLKCLSNDKISEPIKQIKRLAEKVVNVNEKSN